MENAMTSDDHDNETDRGDRRERGGEGAVGDVRQRADDHVLRIAGDRGDAAGVGGQGDGEEIGHRIALQPLDEIEDERRHHQADRVVDEKGREDTGDEDDRRKQDERMAGARDDPAVDQPEEAGKAEIGDDDHHPEEEGDGLHVDGARRPPRG